MTVISEFIFVRSKLFPCRSGVHLSQRPSGCVIVFYTDVKCFHIRKMNGHTSPTENKFQVVSVQQLSTSVSEPQWMCDCLLVCYWDFSNNRFFRSHITRLKKASSVTVIFALQVQVDFRVYLRQFQVVSVSQRSPSVSEAKVDVWLSISTVSEYIS